MKRFLILLVAALMVVSCVSAFAEVTTYEEMGLSLDFSAIENKSQNIPSLEAWGVQFHEPYMAMMSVSYTAIEKGYGEAIALMMNETDDEEEYQELENMLSGMTSDIASIIVTNAKTLGEAGIKDPLPDGYEATEFGTVGDYHFYYIVHPLDELAESYEELKAVAAKEDLQALEEAKTADLADAKSVQTEVLKMLKEAKLSQPVDNTENIIGQVIQFETTDLDGNRVSSADLFKNNKITMINMWGTWCINCLNEMSELAEIHTRLQGKGCGVVGVEYEMADIKDVVKEAKEIFEKNGTNYPNVIMPENNPIFSQMSSYPTSIFVDSEGKILTWPIEGAAVSMYESTVDKLLAGENVSAAPETGATANESGAYRVFVYDKEGNPVKGAVVQLCDDKTCSFQKTKEDGAAIFNVTEQKVYEVHVQKVPEGYAKTEDSFKTLETWSDINIFVEKAQ